MQSYKNVFVFSYYKTLLKLKSYKKQQIINNQLFMRFFFYYLKKFCDRISFKLIENYTTNQLVQM